MKYRIILDNNLGFKVEVREWFWPIWEDPLSLHVRPNTFSTLEEAEEAVTRLKRIYNPTVVKTYN